MQLCAFAIERSGGVFFAPAIFPTSLRSVPAECGGGSRVPQELCLTGPKYNLLQESIMSAWNGDKSRFNRERKQKIAKRKRIRELLHRAGTASKPVAGSVGAKPRTVTA
jgi:hypothetical protein